MQLSNYLFFTTGCEAALGFYAQCGVVTTPLGMQPWGAFYGKLTDRFGVQWMLNCPV